MTSVEAIDVLDDMRHQRMQGFVYFREDGIQAIALAISALQEVDK